MSISPCPIGPAELNSVLGVMSFALGGRGQGLIQLGVLLLIATPVACGVFGVRIRSAAGPTLRRHDRYCPGASAVQPLPAALVAGRMIMVRRSAPRAAISDRARLRAKDAARGASGVPCARMIDSAALHGVGSEHLSSTTRGAAFHVPPE